MTPELRRQSTYRPDIDGLRAIAIIPVVLFHAFPGVMRGGFVGVDIFFVISGFLISGVILHALQSRTFSFAGFYANRIRRLFPSLVIVLAASFAFGWFFLLPDEYAQLGKHIVGSTAYVENFVLRSEAGYFDIRSSLKPLIHIWSLSIEEQFYLTYPAFLLLVWRFRRNALAILAVVALASFWMNSWQIHRDVVSAFFLPQTRCWELMAGCILACWQSFTQDHPQRKPWVLRWLGTASFQLPTPLVSNGLSLLGTLLVTVAVLRIHENDGFPGWWALLPVCGAALLIAAGPGAWINRKILANRAMVFVGLISYPLYLWHWPVLTFPRIIRGEETSAGVRVAGVLLSFGLAWVTWRWVEKPVRFGRKTWVKTAVLVASSVVVGSLGYLAHYRNGFNNRFPTLRDDLSAPELLVWSTSECRAAIGLSGIDFCRSPRAGVQPDVLLIGDSHAGSLYSALAPAFEKRSQTLLNLGEAGCVPFFDTESHSRDDPKRAHCEPVMNRILEFAAASKSSQTIILSFRGPFNMSGQNFGSWRSGEVFQEIRWEHAAQNSSQAEMFAGALTETISRLSATGKTLILFVDWPELGFDARSCLARPVTWFSRPRPLCGVPRPEVNDRNRAYREVIAGLTRKFPRLRVFDPFPYLCDSSACYAMSAGHLLYRDDNHLSAAGARYLAEKFFEEQASAPPFVASSARVH